MNGTFNEHPHMGGGEKKGRGGMDILGFPESEYCVALGRKKGEKKKKKKKGGERGCSLVINVINFLLISSTEEGGKKKKGGGKKKKAQRFSSAELPICFFSTTTPREN